MDVISKIDDAPAVATKIVALLTYVHDIFLRREVVKQRKQWDNDRQNKIGETIVKAMKQWDNENYPRMLQATWGWHLFYPSLWPI